MKHKETFVRLKTSLWHWHGDWLVWHLVMACSSVLIRALCVRIVLIRVYIILIEYKNKGKNEKEVGY